VQSAREAAKRSQCVNNLKQIGLALHNFHDANNRFPGDIKDKDGKTLLSWRVQILPYIEQQALYNKFKLDEPWDSANNKPLIDQMPMVFACPTNVNRKPGQTHYRGFTGKGGFFEDGDGVQIASITDGTSNTIAVAEFKDGTIWSKPDQADTDDPSAFLASEHPGGFNVLFGDGSVRLIKDTIAKAILKALVSRNGGEIINFNDF
jgi:prepilin-type processing-associated H-X9-DG protein